MAFFGSPGMRAPAVLLVLALAGTAEAEGARTQQVRVLVLGGNLGRPSFEAFMEGFRGVSVDPDAREASIQIEDLSGPIASGGEEWLLGWMSRKYAGERFDVLVATTGAPLELVQVLRDRLWKDARVVTVGPDTPLPGEDGPPPGVTLRVDARRAVEVARTLFPGLRRIVYVGGADWGGPNEVAPPGELARASGLPVERMPPLSLEDLGERLAALPGDAVVFYAGIFRDGEGRRFIPRDALEYLSEVSSRPIVAVTDTLVGFGTVGGLVVDSRESGRQAGRIAMALARDPARTPAGDRQVTATRVLLDHRQLERWNVPDVRIPRGADVLFRPPSIWEAHRPEVLVAGVAMALMAAVIGRLLVERHRRRAAERQLRGLSSSVIQAQETERGRVSRELHDDVNQRLALATIELDRLSRSPALPVEEGRQARAVRDRLRLLGRDVHDIAYRLRPTEIEFVGLVPALRGLAGNVASTGRMAVEVVDAGWPPDAGPEAGIVLYRVAQEALQNAMKHSGAAAAKVIVSGNDRTLTLDVTDDGRGFDPAGAADVGRLGLAGMRERIRQVGGTLAIESLPGTGTRIEAVVPRPVTLRTNLEEVSHA